MGVEVTFEFLNFFYISENFYINYEKLQNFRFLSYVVLELQGFKVGRKLLLKPLLKPNYLIDFNFFFYSTGKRNIY